MNKLSSHLTKAAHERVIFAEFVSTGRPDIDPATIASCDPPAPDIACSTFDRERLAFELVELCAPEIAQSISADIKRGGGASFIRTSDPTAAAILGKLERTYVSPVPVDLLCYTGGRLVTPDDVIVAEVLQVVSSEGLGPFRSIWLLGEKFCGPIA